MLTSEKGVKPLQFAEDFLIWPKNVAESSMKNNSMFQPEKVGVINIDRIVYWRRATNEEVRTEVIPRCNINSAAYRTTIKNYGNKIQNFD